ncbi:MAG TPA: hypothetical protein VMB52_05955 [Verrucomicrobiae bacterium]|nr:hypothetical protein [Verrucomicrobiae bacterium]
MANEELGLELQDTTGGENRALTDELAGIALEQQPPTYDHRARWAEINAPDWEGIRSSLFPERYPALSMISGELSLESIHSGDLVGMYALITETYFGQKSPDELEQLNVIYRQLHERDAGPSGAEPRSTVAIAVAAHNEDPALLAHTLEAVAGVRGIEQDEVLVYGNMPDTLFEAERTEAQANIDATVNRFRTSHPAIRIRSVIVEYSEAQLRMSKVRADMIELIARDGQERNFRFDHPVITFDADTASISEQTNEVLAGALTAEDSHLLIPHADVAFDVTGVTIADNPADTELPEHSDDATRLAAVAEIDQRLSLARERKEYDVPNMRQYSYPEEWGSAIPLGPTLMVGNFNIAIDSSEMGELEQRFMHMAEEIREAMRIAKPLSQGDVRTVAVNFPEALVTTSGRRWEQVLRDWITLPAGADDKIYLDNVKKWHMSGPTGLYQSREQFGHTDSVRIRTYEGPFTASDEIREARIQAIINAMLGATKRSDEMERVLSRFDLPKPTTWLDEDSNGSLQK